MITILMAAYNGEKYIAEQIESILYQTELNWKLIIQDDCSSDGTFAIAESYAHRYPDRISAVRRITPSGSAQNNFFSMLHFADSEYIMFCDDDDVWLPEKIHVSLLKMKKLEKAFSNETPLLVHTDLRVTDSELNTISDSLMHMQKLNPTRTDLNHMFIQNIVTGCTVMVNRHLLKLSVEHSLPQHAVMHDWWFALIASSLGQIDFSPEVTVLYRQHENNQVGAKRANAVRYNLRRFADADGAHRSLTEAYEQAKEFLTLFGALLDDNQQQLVQTFISIPSHSKLGRLFLICKYNFWRTGLFRKVGQIWFS